MHLRCVDELLQQHRSDPALAKVLGWDAPKLRLVSKAQGVNRFPTSRPGEA